MSFLTPGDSGAWVVSPDTGSIYGIVVAVCRSLHLTYILPAETIFESIIARSSKPSPQLQDLFPAPATDSNVILTQTVFAGLWRALEDPLDSGREFTDEHYRVPEAKADKQSRYTVSDSGVGSSMLRSVAPSLMGDFESQNPSPRITKEKSPDLENATSLELSSFLDTTIHKGSVAIHHNLQSAAKQDEKQVQRQNILASNASSQAESSAEISRPQSGTIDLSVMPRVIVSQARVGDDFYVSNQHQISNTPERAPGKLTQITKPQMKPRPGSAPTCLSPLGIVFAQIDLLAFRELQAFITNQPTILEEHPRRFLCQAALALVADDRRYAKICVQRSLLISRFSDMDSEDIEEYLTDLASQRRSTLKAFLNDLDKAYDSMKNNLSQLTSAAFQIMAQPPSQSPNDPAGNTTQDSRPRHASAYSSGLEEPSSVVNPHPGLAIRPSSDPSARLPPLVEHARPSRHHEQQPPRLVRTGTGSQGSLSPFVHGGYHIRGTPGEIDGLGKRFRRQGRPSEFFVVGKVFAILWYENTGVDGKSAIDMIGPFGEQIFTRIRRRVVVRARYGPVGVSASTPTMEKGLARNGAVPLKHGLTLLYTTAKKFRSALKEKNRW